MVRPEYDPQAHTATGSRSYVVVDSWARLPGGRAISWKQGLQSESPRGVCGRALLALVRGHSARREGALACVSRQGRLHHRSDALATAGGAPGIKGFCQGLPSSVPCSLALPLCRRPRHADLIWHALSKSMIQGSEDSTAAWNKPRRALAGRALSWAPDSPDQHPLLTVYVCVYGVVEAPWGYEEHECVRTCVCVCVCWIDARHCRAWPSQQAVASSSSSSSSSVASVCSTGTGTCRCAVRPTSGTNNGPASWRHPQTSCRQPTPNQDVESPPVRLIPPTPRHPLDSPPPPPNPPPKRCSGGVQEATAMASCTPSIASPAAMDTC